MVEVPLIAVEPPCEGRAGLGPRLDELSRFDWVVVTSATAVDEISLRLPADGRGPRWAAVGPATAGRLEGAGVKVSLVPARHHAEALAEQFPAAPAEGGRVLVLRAKEPAVDLSAALTAKGWAVESVPVYRTVPTEPAPAEVEELRAADAITLASPSAVSSLVRLGVRNIPVVCIGEATARAARAAALEVSAVAEEPSPEAFTAAVIAAVGWET